MSDQPSAYLLPNAELRWTGDSRPHSIDFDDIYFSGDHGIEEKEYVFLKLNALESRWGKLPRASSGHYTLVETGFGIGLNFLLASRLWEAVAPEGWQLHYVSVENHPLSPADLRRATSTFDGQLQADRLLEIYPRPSHGFHRRHFTSTVTLSFLYMDVAEAIHAFEGKVDTWFLDGFRPDHNPDMWAESLWPRMFQLSRPGANFSTYSAAGWVRRGLETGGFQVRRQPGFGRKKELLTGERKGTWTPSIHQHATRATIIGAGLAGTTCAAALASRGIQVTLLDSARKIVTGASGMHQLAYYPQLGAIPTPGSLYALDSFQYTTHYLREFAMRQGLNWAPCGFFRALTREREENRFSALRQQFKGANDIARWVDRSDTPSVTGIQLRCDGILYPEGGWIDPRELAHGQLEGSDVELLTDHPIASIERKGDRWRLTTRDGLTLPDTEMVIIASGYLSPGFEQLGPLPLKTVRGQTAHLPFDPALDDLKMVIGGSATLFPIHLGMHNLAATYDADDGSLELKEDHEKSLLTELKTVLSVSNLTGGLGGTVGFRSVARDRMPVIGPVPDWPHLLEAIEPLRRDASAQIHTADHRQPGLFVATGFGSHGLSQIPLACEHLASMVCGEPSPLPRSAANLVSPERFLIRDAKHQKDRPSWADLLASPPGQSS